MTEAYGRYDRLCVASGDGSLRLLCNFDDSSPICPKALRKKGLRTKRTDRSCTGAQRWGLPFLQHNASSPGLNGHMQVSCHIQNTDILIFSWFFWITKSQMWIQGFLSSKVSCQKTNFFSTHATLFFLRQGGNCKMTGTKVCSLAEIRQLPKETRTTHIQDETNGIHTRSPITYIYLKKIKQQLSRVSKLAGGGAHTAVFAVTNKVTTCLPECFFGSKKQSSFLAKESLPHLP